MKTKPLLGWAFALPALTFIAVFLIYPTVKTILLSFDTGAGFGFSEYVGTRNYVNLFTKDRYFFYTDTWPPTGAFFNTFRWLIFFTLGTVGFGLIVAVMANSVRVMLIKTIIFIRWRFPSPQRGSSGVCVYHRDPQTGILNAPAHRLTRTDPSPGWAEWTS
jgi:ABC-type sugar transport system permease subunit